MFLFSICFLFVGAIRLNTLLFGVESAFWFHIVNVLLHGLSSILFTRICSKVCGFKRNYSLIAGIFFAVHPIHTESKFKAQQFKAVDNLKLFSGVSGIVGRAELLGCTLFSLSFLSYHGYVTKFHSLIFSIQVFMHISATMPSSPMIDPCG